MLVTELGRPIAGRREEQRVLAGILESTDAELVAVYGRRRVGKTHLVREFFAARAGVYFAVTGQKDAPARMQLEHFKRELERVFSKDLALPELRSWDDAFAVLTDAVERHARSAPSEPIVVFLDELPWLATRRSGLLQTLDHYWNTRLSRVRSLRLIVCGSASSFMLDKLIHARGGLHNRITRQMLLAPFTLAETREFLASRGIRWKPAQILELYLALGGIPHYLRLVERGRSAAQAIGLLCFSKAGELREEFHRLLASLFANASAHEEIVRALASRHTGVDRSELIAVTGIPSGGAINRPLRELEEAGFIASFTPWGKRTKHTTYRLIDEYVWFYLRWIEKAPRGVLARGGQEYWHGRSQTPGYRAWAGYAFEGVALKHADRVRAALGLSGIATDTGTWRHVAKAGSGEPGAQVDLLFDRADGVITLCELKYSREPFVLTRDYARELMRKLSVFAERTRTRKDLRFALVCPAGIRANAWSDELIDHVVDVTALFD